jgi:hypothetical protein
MKKSTFEAISYIGLAGILIGYYGFREPFMDWFWSVGIFILGLLGTPVALSVIFALLVLFLLYLAVIWVYRVVLWG